MLKNLLVLLDFRLDPYLIDNFDESLHLLGLVRELIVVLRDPPLEYLQLLPVGGLVIELNRNFHEAVAEKEHDAQKAEDKGEADEATQDAVTKGLEEGGGAYLARAVLPLSVVARTITRRMKATK